MSNETVSRRLLHVLGNSLVCISGCVAFLDAKEHEQGKRQVFAYTAFAMSFDDIPALVTAGHVIKDELDPLLQAGHYQGYPVRILECNLCDFMGESRKVLKPMPFDYSLTKSCSIDQSLQRTSQGLDFGIIMTHPFYWRSMEANGITPIPEERWVESFEEEFDVYKMIGIPMNATLQQQGLAQPVLYTVTKSDDSGIRIGPDGQPVWFVGNLPAGVRSVRGVSGGPIFGFRKVAENQWDYRVVAMQSWEDQSQGLIYGTPLLSFAPVVSKIVRELREDFRRTQAEQA